MKIVCTREGEQVPRVAGDAEAGYRLVDHEIRWAIGPSRINTIGDFGQRLRLLIHDPARRVRGLDGTFQQMPVEFEAAAFAVYYGDVVATMDAALDAGVLRLQLLEGCVVSLRAVTEPTAYGRDLMPPEARFCEPDDAPPTWRPVLRIDQRGRVFDGATLLHDPAKQADDLRRVDEGLAGFRQQAEARSLIETVETGGGKSVRITAPIMLVGDRWTDWHHLRRVAERATRAGFWKVHLAVVKIDLEAATRPAPQRKK